jgi:hypothetical protein
MIEAQTGTNYNGDHIHLSILPTILTWTAPCKAFADNTDNRVCNTGNQFLRMEILTGWLFRATTHKQSCKLFMIMVLTTNGTATEWPYKSENDTLTKNWTVLRSSYACLKNERENIPHNCFWKLLLSNVCFAFAIHILRQNIDAFFFVMSMRLRSVLHTGMRISRQKSHGVFLPGHCCLQQENSASGADRTNDCSVLCQC